MEGASYAERAHFLEKSDVAVLASTAVHIVEESNVDVHFFFWYLRPHHVADDFAALFVLVRRTFHLNTSRRKC